MLIQNNKVANGGITNEGKLLNSEWNQLASEFLNMFAWAGQVSTAGDLNQVGKNIAAYANGGQYYIDSGVADSYLLTAAVGKQAPPFYFDGMIVKFLVTNTNTGASDINVAGIGTVALTKFNGTNLDANALRVNQFATCVYRAATNSFVLIQYASNILIIESSTNYLKPPDLDYADVALSGGGGAGGGNSGVDSASGGGGGGGGYAWRRFFDHDLAASEAVIIAAGGLGVLGGGGGTGGTSFFGGFMSATGGRGGIVAAGAGAAANGGDGIGGTINITGQGGGANSISAAAFVSSGVGGSSQLGGGGEAFSNGDGADGSNWGGGGSGAANSNGVFSVRTGGDGASGVCIVTEFFKKI